MKRKLRIFSHLAIICLSVCMFAFGVYAASTVSVTTSGTVTFNATGVYANITRTVTGYDEEKSTVVSANYSQIINSTTAPESEKTFNDLNGEKFIFEDANTEIIMSFTITNLATEEGRNIYVKLIDNETTPADNITKMAVLDAEYVIAPNTSKTIPIYISVNDENSSGNASYNYTFILQNESSGTILNGDNATFTEIKSGTEVVGYSVSGLKTVTPALTNIVIPATYNGLPVTEIASSAFSNKTSLTSVTIEEGITTINNRAFNGCSNLKSIVLPDSLTSLGEYAFSNCTNLLSVSLPKSVSYGSSMFPSSCKNVHYRGTLSDWLSESFSAQHYSPYSPMANGANLILNGESVRNLIIPEEITKIKQYSFLGCENIKTVTFGSNVEQIDKYSFSGCENIKTVTFGSNVEQIGEYAFKECTGITKTIFTGTINEWLNIQFEWNSNPVSISKNLYINNTEVTSVTIPDEMTQINAHVFEGCASLTSLTMHSNVTSIGGFAFEGCIGLTGELELPSSLKELGSDAFADCTGLTGDLTLPSGLEELGSGAFYGCTGLNGTLTLSESLTSLWSSTFVGCPFTGELIIPDSIEYFDEWVFDGCKVTSLHIGSGFNSFYSYQGSLGGFIALETITVDEDNERFYTICDNNALIVRPDEYNAAFVAFVCKDIDEYEYMDLMGETSGFDFNFGCFDYCYNLNSCYIDEYTVGAYGSFSFMYCENLIECDVYDNEYMNSFDFTGCINLNEIRLNISSSHNDISFYFEGCESLDTIYYYGSQYEWNNKISISSSLMNDITVYCDYNYSSREYKSSFIISATE